MNGEPQAHWCKSCRFWSFLDHLDEDIDLGECRRFPPQLPNTAAQQEASEHAINDEHGKWQGWFPQTLDCDWCGEFRQKGLPDG